MTDDLGNTEATMELLAREAGKRGYTKMAVVCGASLMRMQMEALAEKYELVDRALKGEGG